MGTDIFGVPLDVGSILSSGVAAVETNALSQVGQSQAVQTAVASTAQKQAAATLADNILKYKTPLLIGGGIILGLLIFRR